MDPKRKSRGPTWQEKNVEREKQRIKSELSEFNSHPDEKLDFLLEQIGMLDQLADTMSQLSRFIYVISTFVHHCRFGGLENKQIKQLSTLAQQILKFYRVKPRQSKLSYLHTELHLALSQVYRREGAHWEALWEERIANHFRGNEISEQRKGHQLLSAGRRALRVGHLETAINCLQQALSHPLDAGTQGLTQLELLRAYRLSADEKTAAQLANTLLQQQSLSPELRLDIQWEQLWIQFGKTRDPFTLLNATKHKASHRSQAYLVEAYLLFNAIETDRFRRQFPTFNSFARGTQRPSSARKLSLYKLINTVETLNKGNKTTEDKIALVGQTLPLASTLITIDRELLVRAAFCRWFFESDLPELANPLYDEYRALCLKISAGKSCDTLGVFGSDHPERKAA